MARTKRGVVSRAKHNKVLKSVKGQTGRRKNKGRTFKKSWGKRGRKFSKRGFRDRRSNWRRKKRNSWCWKKWGGKRG